MKENISNLRRLPQLLAALLSGLVPLAAQASIVSFTKFKTTVATNLPVPQYVDPTQKIVVCTIGPLTVQAGDVVSAHSQMEATFTGTDKIDVCDGIVVATRNDTVDQTKAGFVGWVARLAGGNLDPAQMGTTDILQRTGSYKFAAASSSIYINYIGYAKVQTGVEPDVIVPASYAELTAVVERGVTWTETRTMNFTSLPIDAPTLHVLNSVGPLAIPVNSMVDVRFDIEASSNALHASDDKQNLGRTVVLSTSATSAGGTTMTRENQGSIIHYSDHHYVFSHVGGLFFPAANLTAYFNSAVYASGSDSQPFTIETTPDLYGHFQVEVRPSATNQFFEDTTPGVATLTSSTPVVLYSVGPMTISNNSVVEVRYQATLGQPSSATPLDCEIIRAGSATATTGTLVLRPLYRKIPADHTYSDLIHSTAEQNTSGGTLTNQYYNVVVWLPSGGSVPVSSWGELEAVIR